MRTELRQSPDNDVVELLAAKQYREAFEMLLPRYKDKVFRLCFSMMRNESHAEDMTQEIFLRIWKALAGYQGQASLSTWIYTIARNRCLTDIRKWSSRPTISLAEPEVEAAVDQVAAEQADPLSSGAEMDIDWLLGQLSEKYRQTIVLYYLEQRSYEEVAAMLGVPLGTVKTFLHRGKKELLRIGRRAGQFSCLTAPAASVGKTNEVCT